MTISVTSMLQKMQPNDSFEDTEIEVRNKKADWGKSRSTN
jgi:hypothetical protein